MSAEVWFAIGVGLMAAGGTVLVVLTARRVRARRARRSRVAQRRVAYGQGSTRAGWPWAEPMPPMRAGLYRGALVRDVDATAVMARVRGDDRG